MVMVTFAPHSDEYTPVECEDGQLMTYFDVSRSKLVKLKSCELLTISICTRYCTDQRLSYLKEYNKVQDTVIL